MYEARDHAWYRAEAERFRQKAERAPDAGLRDSYLKLAAAYESLAGMLDRTRTYPVRS